MKFADYPQMLATACENLAPHTVAFWLKDCAATFHAVYNAEKVLVEDTGIQHARLALYAATRRVLANGLTQILGMSAPEKM